MRVSFSIDRAKFLCSYSWALVHSHRSQDVRRGLELVAALVSADPKERRELLYLKSVGQYRLKNNLEARETLKSLLEEFPEFRQAESLLETVENEIVKEGLIGVGVGAAVVGVVGALAVSALRKR